MTKENKLYTYRILTFFAACIVSAGRKIYHWGKALSEIRHSRTPAGKTELFLALRSAVVRSVGPLHYFNPEADYECRSDWRNVESGNTTLPDDFPHAPVTSYNARNSVTLIATDCHRRFLANMNSCLRSLYVVACTVRPSVCLSVCLSSVCNDRAPYTAGWNLRQCFYAIWYLGHPLTSTETFTGKPLRWEV